ncbi:MAG TPA: PxKF domain-containing protein [Nocardioides sp.]|jgi:hypothetical protein|nr:PxKF domain-containing protein [Nocardioides sp.]
MITLKKWTGRAAVLATTSVIGVLALSGIAVADNIQDTIADTGTEVTLVAGSGVSGTASIRVVANNAAGDPDPGCNIDAGENPLTLDVITPAGVTANPDPLSITSCGTGFPVTFTASSTAVSGPVTVTVLSGPAGGGTYVNQVSIPITVTQPAPTNAKPSVEVTGVTDPTYEIGSEPTVGCAVTDVEDTNPTATPMIDRSALSHGLGVVTVTCDYTDEGHLAADTATATYTIVDTTDPTITHTLSSASAENAAGWYNKDVTVQFACHDTDGSGIQSCTDDTTLGEGANQSVTGTATDWAGNTATDTVSGINIDETAPTVSLVGGPSDGGTYYFGDTPAPPTCEASDVPDTSGLAGACHVAEVVTGNLHGGGEVHTFTASATDNAGNEATTDSVSYTLLPWTTKGFYQPVDMSGVWNTVKGGSTVPLKFEIFAGSTEKTDTSAVKSFTQRTVTCPNSSATVDEIELTTTGGTSLRYDATGGQFVQNWATPKRPGTCYVTTMTAQDGSTISANFLLK